MRKEVGRQTAQWENARADALTAIAPKDFFDGSVPPPGTSLGNLLVDLDEKERNHITALAASLERSSQMVPSDVKAFALRSANARFSAIREKILQSAAMLCTAGEEDESAHGGQDANLQKGLAQAPAGAGDESDHTADGDIGDDGVDGASERRVRPKRSVTTSAAYTERMAAARAAFDDCEDTPLGAAATQTLRAWMLDHFLFPYPSDADKKALAKATGLKRMQVSNWFINARVRIWRPAILAMSKELDKGRSAATEAGSAATTLSDE